MKIFVIAKEYANIKFIITEVKMANNAYYIQKNNTKSPNYEVYLLFYEAYGHCINCPSR